MVDYQALLPPQPIVGIKRAEDRGFSFVKHFMFTCSHNRKRDMKGLEMKLSTLSHDHLGLVVAIFDALDISEVIDESIPKICNCKLSHSAIIKALVINGLGFAERRLYIFPRYLKIQL